MAEYIRVATFEVDDAALDALLEELGASDGAPEGVTATRITVLADRSAGKVLIGTRFASEEDLRAGDAALNALNPPNATNMRRVSVDTYEVALERQL
jgi:hypothetical protein